MLEGVRSVDDEDRKKEKLPYYVALCTLFILIGTITAEAATCYVATTGNDAHVCSTAETVTTPKRTISSGITCLKPGDNLYIRAGTYAEANLTSKVLIKPERRAIAGYPGEKPTVRYSEGTYGYGVIKARGNRGWLVFENLIIDEALSGNGTGWTIGYGNHDFILRSLEIKNFRYNGITVSANNVQILNCQIHHQVSIDAQRWYGIYYHDGANGVDSRE